MFDCDRIASCVLAGVLAIGCGRIGFEATRGGGTARDAPPDTVDPSLILWFPFDGSFVEAVSGNAPTCLNGNCPTLAPGKIGTAAQFDGSLSCLVLPDDGRSRTANVTLALWLNQPANGEFAPFSKLYMPLTTVFDSWQVENHSTQQYGFTTQNAGSKDTELIAGPAPGSWHHVAMTYDGATKLIYFDGSPASMEVQQNPIEYDSSEIVVGCDENNGGFLYFYDGLLDDVRFYDRALSSAEVMTLAQQ